MSLGYEKIRIAVEKDGKKLYVSAIEFKDDGVNYRLLEDEGQVYLGEEAARIVPRLRKLDPETKFIVEGVDTEK